MSVKINIPSYLQPFTNEQETVEVTGSTVGECLHRLVEQFPELGPKVFAQGGKLLDFVSIYLDGEFAYGDQLDKAVRDSAELHILYTLGGG